MTNTARLRDFVRSFTRLADQPDEERIFVDGRALLAELIAHDDWLPPQFAAAVRRRATSSTCCTAIRSSAFR